MIVIVWAVTGSASARQSMANHGTPYFHVFSTDDYPSEQQIFDALEWHDGTMIFANAGGLVQHADDEWEIFARFDASFLSELEASRFDSTIIWAGSYSNIGYFKQNELGEFSYHSLTHKISVDYTDFSEVYAIEETQEGVFFFSDLYLFEYSKIDSTVRYIPELKYGQDEGATPVIFSEWNNDLYAFLVNGNVLKQQASGWEKVTIQGVTASKVVSVTPVKDGMVLFDLQRGLLRFDGVRMEVVDAEIQHYLLQSEVNDLASFGNDDLAISTDVNGVFVLDKDFQTKFVFNKQMGLTDDSYNGVFIDSVGDLWLCGQSSIVVVYTSVPVTHYSGEAYGFGDALHITEYNDELYIAAMIGLFRKDKALTSEYFKQPEATFYSFLEEDETFWNFVEAGDQLLVASHVGIFEIKGDQIIPVVRNVEARQLRLLTDEILLVVTYNGLDWLKKKDGRWQYMGTIKEVSQHVLELAVVPDKEFWAGGVQGTVFRGRYDSNTGQYEIKEYSVESGLPETDMLEPTYTGGQVIINSKYGFYRFEETTEIFIPLESINKQLGNWGEYLRMDNDGTLWTSYANIEGYSGVIQIVPNDELEWKANYTPFEISSDHYGDFLEVDENGIWMGATESVMYLDRRTDFEIRTPEVLLWSVLSLFDQELLSYRTDTPAAINYAQKNVQINVVSSSNRKAEKNQFRFKIGNTEWSEWRSESEFTLNPFFPGNKKIWVQTRDFMRVESTPTLIEINIEAPWYLSHFAYLLYGVLFIGGFVGLVRYVSGYRIQQQMNKMKLEEIERIIELDELKNRLLINISHELRTPLTLVTGPVKQLLDSKKIEDDFLLHKLQMAHRNGRRLHELVEQVLDLSRLDSNIIEFKPTEIPLSGFLSQVVDSFETAIEKKSLRLSLIMPEQEIPFQADADKLEKILVNLISNAVKFTPEKGSIEVKLTNRESDVCIEITDSGRGIQAKDINHVFERFHSTSDQLEGGGQGIGVGLSITKEFVELHDGEIKVESEAGKGARFMVRLPKKNYEKVDEYELVETEMEAELVKKPLMSANSKGYSALVVEDNPDMREYVSGLLAHLDISVMQAENGLKGKQQLSVSKPDIIISDIMMPEMNGFEFAQWMRSVPEFKNIPIILLSARSEVQDKVHGFQLGVSDYLTKPFNAQELQARVDNLLMLKKEREEMALSTKGEEAPMSADSEIVQQLQHFVESKIQSANISVEDLAAQAAMSTRNLQRSLKSITGFTPVEFIREVRLYTARDLLESKQKRSISEVAYAVGFSTPAYFSKLYKKRFGNSPSEYF